MDGFVAWLKQLQFDGVWQTAVLVAASLLCITFHETCHGLVAYWLGDPTAKRAGRLTLNPLRHVDIGGLLMMALFRFGWAKPVPVDMRYFKHPKRDMALTAAAGPLSNVLLAYLAVLLYSVFAYWYYFSGSTAVYVFALFSITSRSFRRDWLCSTFFLSRRSTGLRCSFPACPIKLTSGSCAMSATAWRF